MDSDCELKDKSQSHVIVFRIIEICIPPTENEGQLFLIDTKLESIPFTNLKKIFPWFRSKCVEKFHSMILYIFTSSWRSGL